jgi:hypothetical protein
MARTSKQSDPDVHPDTRRGFHVSVWTFVAPVALAACVLVLYAIARDAGWTRRHHDAARVTRTTSGGTSTSAANGEILVRPHKAETLIEVGVRYGIAFGTLKALNPALPAAGPLPAGHRVRLR